MVRLVDVFQELAKISIHNFKEMYNPIVVYVFIGLLLIFSVTCMVSRYKNESKPFIVVVGIYYLFCIVVTFMLDINALFPRLVMVAVFTVFLVHRVQEGLDGIYYEGWGLRVFESSVSMWLLFISAFTIFYPLIFVGGVETIFWLMVCIGTGIGFVVGAGCAFLNYKKEYYFWDDVWFLGTFLLMAISSGTVLLGS